MSVTNYRPLFGRVLIQRDVEEKKGSIMIPAHLQQRHSRNEGVVIALGPTAEGVKLGDRVVFGKHAGTWLDKTYSVTVEAQATPYFLCQDEDILLVIDKDQDIDEPEQPTQALSYDDVPTAKLAKAAVLTDEV